MAETYCGKICADCYQKENLNCPGCKEGPGKWHSGDCTLANCCAGKGHQDCSTCGFSGNCGTLRGKDRMPEYRLKSLETEKMRIAAIMKRAPFLGKWLWILFWLVIPASIASVMTNDTVAGAIPAVLVPGQILSAVSSCVYGFVLIRLASEEERYRTAGICTLICGAVSALVAYVSGGPEASSWKLLLLIPAVIVSFVGKYHEFTAHAIVLTDLDYILSEKWSNLWKWYIGIHGAIIGGLLFAIVSPVLGLLITLGASIGIIVVDILLLVYLYRTAKRFRSYC